MLMHTLKKRLKEIDEHYEIHEINSSYYIGYVSRFTITRILKFDKYGISFNNSLNASKVLQTDEYYYEKDILPDLWKITKLVSEYLN